MFLDVFIGKMKSEGFDFDVPGDYNGYMPEPAFERAFHRPGAYELCLAVMGESESKQLDWGCKAVKMSVSQLREWLSSPRWAKNECARMLLSKLPELDPDGEYLLTGVES